MIENSEVKTSKWRSFNDLRAPLMMLYVFAFCGGTMGGLPIWTLVAAMSLLIVGLAFFFERKRLVDLLTFKPAYILVGLGVAGGMYGIFYLVLQYTSGIFVEAAVAGDGSVPPFFQGLVRLKGHIMAIHPAIAGGVGAVLLGTSEELFWRGFVQSRMERLMPHALAVILAAVLYAGFWAVFMGVLAAVAAGIGGLTFGFLTVKLRSLVPAMVSHGLVWLFAVWIFPLV